MRKYPHIRSAWHSLFLRRHLTSTALAVLGLSVGFAASITVYSVARAVLLRPLPGVSAQGDLVSLLPKLTSLPGLPGKVALSQSYSTFQQYQANNGAFSQLSAFYDVSLNVEIGDRTQRLAGQLVSSNYFSTLGMMPAAGRFFSAVGDDATLGLVLSYGLAQQLFGDAAKAVSCKLRVNGYIFEVIGVAAAGFEGTVRQHRVDLWIELEAGPRVVPALSYADLRDPDYKWLSQFFGRLLPKVDAKQAQARLDLVKAAATNVQGDSGGLQLYPYIGVRPAQQSALSTPLLFLAIAVLLVLLVVCANTGCLMMVKWHSRRKELAVRLALGARRRSLLGLLLVEASCLTLLSAVAGLTMAFVLTGVLEGATLGTFLPDLRGLQPDARAIALTAALALVLALAIGLLPGWWLFHSRRLRTIHPLGSRQGGRSARLHQVLLLTQIAAAVVLVLTTGLLVQTLRNLEAVDPGFRPARIANLHLDLELLDYEVSAASSLYERLLERIRVLPGVESAALASSVPFDRENRSFLMTTVRLENRPSEQPLFVPFNVVSTDYFRTLGIPLRYGDGIAVSDWQSSSRGLIVNQRMAEELFPQGNALGQQLRVKGQTHEIIAIAGNVKTDLANLPEPLFYLPVAQYPQLHLTLHLKAHHAPETLVAAARAELLQLDRMAVFEASLFHEEVQHSLAAPRVLSALFGGFGLISLLLAGIGLYGVLAYSVHLRRQEFGVRLALGARPSQILRLVTRQTLWLTAKGIAVGLLAAVPVTRSFTAFLFGVTPMDTMSLATVTFLVLAVGLAAAVAPAAAAARVDPITTLQQE